MCKSLLCPVYTEQISQYLIPAMAYGKYPFPFVDLITTLLAQCREDELGDGKNKGCGRTTEKKRVKIELTPWLLGAFITFGKKEIGKMFVESIKKFLQCVNFLFFYFLFLRKVVSFLSLVLQFNKTSRIFSQYC